MCFLMCILRFEDRQGIQSYTEIIIYNEIFNCLHFFVCVAQTSLHVITRKVPVIDLLNSAYARGSYILSPGLNTLYKSHKSKTLENQGCYSNTFP